MDDFSERKNKELFEKVSEKQLKYAKKTMLLIFVLIGAIFLIMGLVLIACDIRDAENGVLVVFHLHRVAQRGDLLGRKVKVELHAVVVRVLRAGDGHLIRAGDGAGGGPQRAHHAIRKAGLLGKRLLAA